MVANTQNEVTVADFKETLLGHASVRADRVKIRSTVAYCNDDGTWYVKERGNLPETFALSASAVTPQDVANEIAQAKAQILNATPDIRYFYSPYE
jgi:hypothetical protein